MEETITQLDETIFGGFHDWSLRLDLNPPYETFSQVLNVLSPWCLIDIDKNESVVFFKNVTDVIHSMVYSAPSEYKSGKYFTKTHGLEEKKLMEQIVDSLLEEYNIKYGSIPLLTEDSSQGVSEERAEAELLSAGGRQLTRRTNRRFIKQFKNDSQDEPTDDL